MNIIFLDYFKSSQNRHIVLMILLVLLLFKMFKYYNNKIQNKNNENWKEVGKAVKYVTHIISQ